MRLFATGAMSWVMGKALPDEVPIEARIGDGRTIHLPSVVAEFGDEELDFRLYKVLAAHAAGQMEFGTHARDTEDLRAAYAALQTRHTDRSVPRATASVDCRSEPQVAGITQFR